MEKIIFNKVRRTPSEMDELVNDVCFVVTVQPKEQKSTPIASFVCQTYELSEIIKEYCSVDVVILVHTMNKYHMQTLNANIDE